MHRIRAFVRGIVRRVVTPHVVSRKRYVRICSNLEGHCAAHLRRRLPSLVRFAARAHVPYSKHECLRTGAFKILILPPATFVRNHPVWHNETEVRDHSTLRQRARPWSISTPCRRASADHLVEYTYEGGYKSTSQATWHATSTMKRTSR